MTFVSIVADFLCGWGFWSLAHNLGHRWWHAEMRHGKQTPYAHGEREHHRVYDVHGATAWQHAEDPKELFISFPLIAIAPIGLLFVAAYGWLRGWEHCWAFAAAQYLFMVADHQLHILFHKSPQLPGALGRLQTMHLIHHTTHQHNFFFVSGLVWDLLLGTARTDLEAVQQSVHSQARSRSAAG